MLVRPVVEMMRKVYIARAATRALRLVPSEHQGIVSRAFHGKPRAVKLNSDIVVFRNRNKNEKASNRSPWFTRTIYDNPDDARRFLSLPNSNTAEKIDAFIIRKDTIILEGKAASQVGHPIFGSYATGGGEQIYLPNP